MCEYPCIYIHVYIHVYFNIYVCVFIHIYKFATMYLYTGSRATYRSNKKGCTPSQPRVTMAHNFSLEVP